MFETEVYPLLLRDCGFAECHGGEGRFFRVYGPGRARLRAPGSDLFELDPATPQEIDESYARARSMLMGVHGLADSLLLRKPLDTSVGGAGHKGEDAWGRNVYARVDDPAYLVLRKWAATAVPAANQGGTP